MISELTEITEPPEAASFRGWIFYDDNCGSCRNLALRFENFFAARGFHFEPLQREWVQQRLNLTEEQALEEMRVLTSTGEVFGGADAVILLARQIWWAAPLAWLARLPSVHAILHRLYRWVAAHRTCAIKGTAAPSFISRTRWCALAILPLIALATKPFLPPWGFMWLMAFALFLGCKWLTLGTALRREGAACPFRALAYLLAWPGMEATRFLSPELAPRCSRSARSAKHGYGPHSDSAWLIPAFRRRATCRRAAARRLDRNGRNGAAAPFRFLPSPERRLARLARRRATDHERAPALHLSQRILGPALECRLQRPGAAPGFPARRAAPGDGRRRPCLRSLSPGWSTSSLFRSPLRPATDSRPPTSSVKGSAF